MIYKPSHQAPNSFITCFLKESSEEQSVYCWVMVYFQHRPHDLWTYKTKHYTASSEKSCVPFQTLSCWGIRVCTHISSAWITRVHKIKDSGPINSEAFHTPIHGAVARWIFKWLEVLPRLFPASSQSTHPPNDIPFARGSFRTHAKLTLICPHSCPIETEV